MFYVTRRGNSLLTKSILGFIEQYWICESEEDFSASLKCVSDVSSLDVKEVLKYIRIRKVNKLIFGQQNIN